MKILFLVPYPLGEAPSQRFRFEQYLGHLSADGIDWDAQPFLSLATWKILYKRGNWIKKSLGFAKGFVKRWTLLYRARPYDFIFVHREVVPMGPPLIEWWLIYVLKKKTIYDFDDAIWMPNSSASNRLFSFLKNHQNVNWMIRNAYKVAAGNQYLMEYASKLNENAVFTPTIVDTENKHNRIKKIDKADLVLGWTGTHSTVQYLLPLAPVLRRLQSNHPFRFVVISDQKVDLGLRDTTFIKWNKKTEVQDLLRLDIGLMPLDSDPWSEGKCGLKILQYMSLGMIAVATPTRANRTIIDNGENGFLCEGEENWLQTLSKLLAGETNLLTIQQNARKKAVEQYSVDANCANFINLFS